MFFTLLLLACSEKDAEPLDTAALAAGADLYSIHCAACHSPDGTGGTGPDITSEVDEEDEELIEMILEGEDDMPAANVTPEEAQLIVDWMRTAF